MPDVSKDIVLDLWGPYACFTPPYAKVDRYSYAVPTPSAIRGILNAIYGKPEEFYWIIRRIEVMRPVRYVQCKRNEVKAVLGGKAKPICVEDQRTQRSMAMLKDVRYRVTAAIAARVSGGSLALRNQAVRRIEKGQCFFQPYLGVRECECYFAPADAGALPIRETMDLNLMVYDTHDPTAVQPGFSGVDLSLYHCVMEDGVIEVPEYGSPAVLKMGGGPAAC